MGTRSPAGKPRPTFPTVPPARRVRTSSTQVRNARRGEGGAMPISARRAGSPAPMPARTRPGCTRARVASSMASTAGGRATADTTPSPTGIESVAASAVAAPVSPPELK